MLHVLLKFIIIYLIFTTGRKWDMKNSSLKQISKLIGQWSINQSIVYTAVSDSEFKSSTGLYKGVYLTSNNVAPR